MSSDAALLSRTIEEFILSAPNAAVIEDGEVAFSFPDSRYAIRAEGGRCLLHFWSSERNAVRRVIDAEQKPHALRLSVQRFGKSKPTRIEIVRDRERRTPSAQRISREQYMRRLERILFRAFPGWNADGLTIKPDLERSFGPVYVRGMLTRGRSAWAVIGVNEQELQSAIDGALTLGVLWLDHLRMRHAASLAIEGLRLFVPRGASGVIRMRAAHLCGLKFEVFEVAERDEALEQKELSARGNIATRLVRCIDQQRVRGRFAHAISRVREIVPQFETEAVTQSELAFRFRGLEFARVRAAYSANSIELCDEIIFGVGANATTLDDSNADHFRDLLARVAERRGAERLPKDPLWRMQPERWLESLVVADVAAIDTELDPTHVYSQVPAFSASDRAMIDVLCATRSGELAVVELKADEDIHLPMQGLDYWTRVRYHNDRGEFAQYGYFPTRTISNSAPKLYLVAPSLRIHPSTDVLLRYLDPQIDCTIIGLDEHWRKQLRVVFRKRRRATAP